MIKYELINFKGKAITLIFINNVVRSRGFHIDLNRYSLKTYSKLMDRVVRFMEIEEVEK